MCGDCCCCDPEPFEPAEGGPGKIYELRATELVQADINQRLSERFGSMAAILPELRGGHELVEDDPCVVYDVRDFDDHLD